MMRPALPVGIVGYGGYVPRYRLPASEISRLWPSGGEDGPVSSKAVPGLDEDTVTMSIEAARNALDRAGIDPAQIGAVWVGSESHPYAVKPTSTIVAEAIGAVPHVLAADWQFACKAGTEALQAALGLVGSGMVRYGLAIGMDAAQGKPSDALEYTAAAGGAAILVGPAEEAVARCEGSVSYVTDTPDFWRRPGRTYPEHAGRFTGQPAYFAHSLAAARELLAELGWRPDELAHAVFHQPNVRFPTQAGQQLGLSRQQMALGLLSPEIGNAYAGSSLLGLVAALDGAAPEQRILQVSFGSGAGSDAFGWITTPLLPERQQLASTVRDYIARQRQIDYATYLRYRGQIVME
ncbi:MAG: hydroxymethylglutaryl-CoA synthase [Chloroflexi bacterium]|nr:hydroxymethylglutaryl-CoA synthase [Chloroflexota bacterium]